MISIIIIMEEVAMKITRPCDSCEHSRVCGIKEDLSRAIETINDDIKRANSSVITVNVGCAEYREQPTVRRL